MKKSIPVFRIVTCVFLALYSFFTCFYIGKTARYKCMTIVKDPDSGAYDMIFDRITGEAWLYIISGVILILLCALVAAFLFRQGLPSALITLAAAVTAAIYGGCLNTQLAELVFWREPLQKIGLSNFSITNIALSIKPALVILYIASATCYTSMCIVEYKKFQKENQSDQNEKAPKS